MIEEIRDKNSILNLFKKLNYTADPIQEDIEGSLIGLSLKH
jgi:hypothetical protein